MQNQNTTILTKEIVTLPIEGQFLQHATLGELLSEQPTLLVFIRHFGCSLCREMIKDMQLFAAQENFSPVVVVHQGTVAEGEAFFNRHWKGISAIADPEWRLYSAFHIRRGNLMELFGPGAIGAGIRSLIRGNTVGIPMGDPMMMPGIFYAFKNRILWQHHFRHVGDRPDYHTLKTTLQRASEGVFSANPA